MFSGNILYDKIIINYKYIDFFYLLAVSTSFGLYAKLAMSRLQLHISLFFSSSKHDTLSFYDALIQVLCNYNIII